MSGEVLVVLVTGVGAAVCWARGRAVPSRRPDRPPPSGPTEPGRSAVDGPPPSAWARALADAGIDGDPRRWARVAGGGLVVAAVVGGARGGPAGALVVVAVALTVGGVGLRGAAGRGLRRADAQLADLLEHAGRGLRGGLDLVPSLRGAAGTVGGVHGHEVGVVVARVEGGAPLPVALEPWAAAHPRPPVLLAIGALEVACLAGGARARALDGVAATLRGRAAVADEARALASQARASAAVLVALPVVVAVLGAVADPGVAGDLLGTRVGLACLAGAAVLDTVGAWWMHRIVAVER